MRTYLTVDGVPITDGLRVWTNNARAGVVSLSGSWEENGKLWFEVREDDRGNVLQSNDRVATQFNGKRA